MNNNRLLAGMAVAVVLALLAALDSSAPVLSVQGAIAGGLLGLASSQGALLVQRHLQRSGDVHCVVQAWTGGKASSGGMGYGNEGAHRTFDVKFLNERDVGTALWNMRAEFYKNGHLSLS